MKKERRNDLAAGFLLTAIGASILGKPTVMDTISINETYNRVSEEAQNQILEEADEYLSQLIVQSRYVAAASIVWVYGCADKS